MWKKRTKPSKILWIGFGGGDIILRCSTWTRLSVQEFWAHEEMGKEVPDWVNRPKQDGWKEEPETFAAQGLWDPYYSFARDKYC